MSLSSQPPKKTPDIQPEAWSRRLGPPVCSSTYPPEQPQIIPSFMSCFKDKNKIHIFLLVSRIPNPWRRDTAQYPKGTCWPKAGIWLYSTVGGGLGWLGIATFLPLPASPSLSRSASRNILEATPALEGCVSVQHRRVRVTHHTRSQCSGDWLVTRELGSLN